MDNRFDIETRWPELFEQLDDTHCRAVVQALANSWHEGWIPDRDDVENLVDPARGAIDDDEYMRRANAIIERHRGTPGIEYHRRWAPYTER
ncbi:hypothetical protein ACIPY5_03620 [Microbacterium sp. NPDC089698]|uniref:antitoxin VbhA family protein n=1 Tax=Microbacterium sp. NPDC089698 TaxID=3364200 RepID=UPI003819E4FA